MRVKFYTSLLLLLFCLSCKNNKQESTTQTEFDKAKWAINVDNNYPHRNDMLKDLISKRKLKGLTKDEITNMLGQPDKIDSNYLFYRINQERLGSFPLHTKTLVIQLSGDTNIIRIHE